MEAVRTIELRNNTRSHLIPFEHVKATQQSHKKCQRQPRRVYRDILPRHALFLFPCQGAPCGPASFSFRGGQNGQRVSVNGDKLRVSTLKGLANGAPGRPASMETRQRSRANVDARKHGATRAQSAACARRARFALILSSQLQRPLFIYATVPSSGGSR